MTWSGDVLFFGTAVAWVPFSIRIRLGRVDASGDGSGVGLGDGPNARRIFRRVGHGAPLGLATRRSVPSRRRPGRRARNIGNARLHTCGSGVGREPRRVLCRRGAGRFGADRGSIVARASNRVALVWGQPGHRRLAGDSPVAKFARAAASPVLIASSRCANFSSTSSAGHTFRTAP